MRVWRPLNGARRFTEYFRGGGYSSVPDRRRRAIHHDPRENIIKGTGPVLQIAEGWSVELRKRCTIQLDARTSSTRPTTRFCAASYRQGPFTDVYSVMANWGANKAYSPSAVAGPDFITLAAMLRIPGMYAQRGGGESTVASAWAAHGMDIEGGYRACGSMARCINVMRLSPVAPGLPGLRARRRISVAPSRRAL